MKDIKILLVFFCLFMAAILFPRFSLAAGKPGQSTTAVPDTRIQVDSFSKPETAAADEGRLMIFVFRDGLPVPGVMVKARGQSHHTDSDGVLALELPTGANVLEFPESQQSVSVNIVPDAQSEVVVNLLDKNVKFQLAAPTPEEAAQDLASAQGAEFILTVRDVTNDSQSGASVRVAGYSGQAVSEAGGVAKLKLPPGEYSVWVSHPKFLAQTKTIQVTETGGSAEIFLKAAESELEEVVVMAPANRGSVAALVEIRKQNNAVSEILGSEQMARQGDSDAASSLRRVTGLTLMGGKYVYVRGLGERYSSVQMNGLSLPSPEPSRRVVPLDLFPTSVLESVVVQKSYTPELPAEFGGGLIQLQTRSLPERPFGRASVSYSFVNTANRLSYKGGAGDSFARDDGTRAMPAAIERALKSGKKLLENAPPVIENEFSAAELQEMGRAFGDSYQISRASGGSLPGVTIAAGNRWRWNQFSLGSAGSLLYSSDIDQQTRETNKYNVGSEKKLELDESATTEITEIERKIGATLDVGMQFGENHELKITNLGIRNSSDVISVKDYSVKGDRYDKRRAKSREWVERDLLTHQLSGKHEFGSSFAEEKAVLVWRGSTSTANRNAPDGKETYYGLNSDNRYELITDSTGNRRNFSYLTDKAGQVRVDFEVPTDFGRFGKAKWKAGGDYQKKTRKADVYKFHFSNMGALNIYEENEDVLFGDGNIGPGKAQLINLSASANEGAASYTGEQKIDAFYGYTEYSPVEALTFVAGARREKSRQEVRTFYYFDPKNPTSLGGLATTNVLPAYSVIYKGKQKLRARLSYGETIARPDFRELSTVPFVDEDSGLETVGNNALKSTVIRNLDHRWEYYFNADEYASVGAFIKDFKNPIEETFDPGVNLRKTFENAEGARNTGFEFETRVDLRRAARFLRRWSILTNVSVIQSKIKLSQAGAGLQTSTNRPLQGQSPYVVNLQLQYDRPAKGSAVTLLYNVIGERITQVGTSGRPDIYERPFHQMDLVASQKILKSASLGFKAKNLLDPEILSTQGDKEVRKFKRGRAYSVSLTMNL